MKTHVIFVGGFLGAGKTTLLWESARKITEMGNRVGLITNDQADELVDTAFLERSNGTVLEVSGSCFCCNFNGLTDAISQAAGDKKCEIIIAEPVGSCTDLSATIVQPLKDKFKDKLTIAPLTALVDPERLADILAGGTSGLHDSAAYIFRKQLEEADIILINKTDLLTRESLETLVQRTQEEWPLSRVSAISAKTGEGLEAWVEDVLNSSASGTHLAEVDYDTYAEGEAVLGWLNATLKLQGKGINWDDLLSDLLYSLGSRFDDTDTAVAHVKLMMETDGKYALGNLTGKSETIRIRGNAGASNEATLTINARVQTSPEELERIVNEEVAKACDDIIRYSIVASKCLMPGRPNPTHRYNQVI